MTHKDLLKIVSNGENLFVEFKHKINFSDKIAHEIVAFANTKGGRLLIGIDDNKTIFGLKNVEEELFAIQNVIKNYILYPIIYSLEKVKINDKKDVIVVEVKEGTNKPNFALEKLGDKVGTAYLRVKDKSMKASTEMVRYLYLKTKNDTFPLKIGTMETTIIQMIEKSGYITVNQLVDTQLLSYSVASEKLINMALAAVLTIIPQENGVDYFVRLEN